MYIYTDILHIPGPRDRWAARLGKRRYACTRSYIYAYCMYIYRCIHVELYMYT